MKNTYYRLDRGFTLIELMIVVAIIGIISAIAFPSYQRHIEKSRRVDAMTVLLEASQFMERQYTLTNSYPSALPSALQSAPVDGGQTYYNIAIDTALSDTQRFTLTAQPIGAQASDSCGNLIIANTGARSPANCWN